jgi:DNA-directed RNA polymerase subunit RPC12/RpoP
MSENELEKYRCTSCGHLILLKRRKQGNWRRATCDKCRAEVEVQKAIEPGLFASGASATGKTDSGRSDYIKAKPLGFWDTFHGFALNEKIVCPHCHKHGSVATKSFKEEKGISGAKATVALLTDGWSLPFTGLSRKALVTEAMCKNCGSKWRF